MYMKEYW